MYHIAALGRRPLEKIMERERTVEPRFLKKPMLPFRSVEKDDVIYFKSNDGYAVAKATVTKTEDFDQLTPNQVVELLDRYKTEISPSETMYDTKIHSKYATLIWFENLQEIRPFFVRTPGSERTGWVTVDDIDNLRSF